MSAHSIFAETAKHGKRVWPLHVYIHMADHGNFRSRRAFVRGIIKMVEVSLWAAVVQQPRGRYIIARRGQRPNTVSALRIACLFLMDDGGNLAERRLPELEPANPFRPHAGWLGHIERATS